MSTEPYPKESAKVHKHFDIGKEETVVTHFACAHKGRMLKQGRLYITQNYLCFYAQIVGKVHKKTIKLTDIADVAKTNYGVFPNAIKVTTRKKKEIVFASFLMRDQAYDAIRKEWLNLRGDVDMPEKDNEIEKSGASPSPRRGSIDPSSGSESEKDSKKKKKRWSLSKKDKKKKSKDSDSSDQTAYSDTEVLESDVSSKEHQRRHSTTGFLRRHSTSSASGGESGKQSLSPTSSAVTPTPTSTSRPTSTSLSSSSSAHPPATSSAPSTPLGSSRGDRAQVLIASGAIKTDPDPATPQANQSQTIEVPTDTHSEGAPTLSLWQRMCYCCYFR